MNRFNREEEYENLVWVKGQSWCFRSPSTPRVTLEQAHSIVTCGNQTHTEVIECDLRCQTC